MLAMCRILTFGIVLIGHSMSQLSQVPPCGNDVFLAEYKAIGCYDNFPIDNNSFFSVNTTGVDCIQRCLDIGRSFAGIENYNTCRCAETIDMFDNHSLLIGEQSCGGRPVLYHSEYTKHLATCQALSNLTNVCSGPNTTGQCFQFCRNNVSFVTVSDIITNKIIACACTNESASNIPLYNLTRTQNTQNMTCMDNTLRICYNLISCNSSFPETNASFIKTNLTTDECLEYCLYVGRQFAGIKHSNQCLCYNDITIFDKESSQHCNTLYDAELYIANGSFVITNVCNNSTWTCNGITITANCSDHCNKFADKPSVLPGYLTGGKNVCHCQDTTSKSSNFTICPRVTNIYKVTNFDLPNTMSSSEKTLTAFPNSNSSAEMIATKTTSDIQELAYEPSKSSAEYTTSSITFQKTSSNFIYDSSSFLITETSSGTDWTSNHPNVNLAVTNTYGVATSDKNNIGSTTSTSEMSQSKTFNATNYLCSCPCHSVSTKWDFLDKLNLTKEQLAVYLEDELAELRRNISIDVKETSAFKNSKKSAPDSRPSSAAMGGLGIIVLVFVFGLIILSDFVTLLRKMSWCPRNVNLRQKS